MRWHSTPQSALNGEITQLAIIECVASVVLYLGIGLYLGTFRYLAWAVVVAPLMLFRTKVSADWGLKVYWLWCQRYDRPPKPFDAFGLLFTALIGAGIRIAAPLLSASLRPLQSLKEAPQNWLRQSLCTDLMHPPEIIPLEATNPTIVPTFAGAINLVRGGRNSFAKILYAFLLLPFALVGWVPPLIYRISFKATAIAYAPFIWIVHATLENPLPLKMRLERITKGELEKVRRLASWPILATLAGKIALVYGLIDLSSILAKFPSQRLMNNLVVPGGWPWWQITLGSDALLTFLLLWFADAALARIDTEQVWLPKVVLNTISTVSFIRATLSLATISHFFYIALVQVAPQLMRHSIGG
jgi:hypothetical protein